MSVPIRVVVVDDQKSTRIEPLERLMKGEIGPKREDLWWLSEFTITSWNAGELASGVSFRNVTKKRPHILIFDLVLAETDKSAGMKDPWKRGLQLLEQLYIEDRRKHNARHNLPRRVFLISSYFSEGDKELKDNELSNFERAREQLGKDLDITLKFFNWTYLERPSLDGYKARDEFKEQIKTAIDEGNKEYDEGVINGRTA